MNKVYFVTGIDTGVGKTIATGMMARFLLKRNLRTATVKLVQTGCHGFSEDLDLHRKLMGCGILPEDTEGLTAPQIFDFPASPHLAAALKKSAVNAEKIADAVRRVSERRDVTLVEGAGGPAVPLTEDLLTIDFIARQGFPVILVSSGKLGSLNHTILSIEALVRRKMRLAGVVYNYCPDADPIIDADTPRMIRKYLRKNGLKDALVILGKVDADRPADVDFSALFTEERS